MRHGQAVLEQERRVRAHLQRAAFLVRQYLRAEIARAVSNTARGRCRRGLRIERIFESEGIEDELGAYNPLIPDGSNWKATLLIEYPDPTQRKTALALPKGIEDRCWVSVR